ncbi:MAG: precorrin-3B synthase [Pseudomonas sp.]|uniref:precorrin-3B synthase n=1 Tax=Pseudomonas abieticivorans TaxID=2931382 RepID=UPI0020C08661|nr:precorrin-3B synthase [Pseudomonas sp. PIA16]MDE1165795.1 precorrin-3B synthase [Pseudomonas sp.]
MPSAKAGIIPRLLHSSAFSRLPGDPLNEPSPARQPSTTVRPSACPGLLRIVQALDGGICRIKLAGGELQADQADAIALAAERHAGGVIEATNRANLQIRGIGAQPQALIDLLLAAGLGPRNAAADDVRNLMLSPTAGIDPHRLLDTRPLAAQILESLENEPRFAELSAKFALLLDGGEALAMQAHEHDLWLGALELDGQTWLAVGLAGCPGHAEYAVPLAQGHACVLAVLNLFLDLATPAQTRMRHLLNEMGADAFIARLPIVLHKGTFQINAATGSPLGTYPQSQAGLVYVGAGAPLGRLDPAMLRGVAKLARDFGDGTLRMTPWQSVLLPTIKAADASQVSAALHALGFVCDASEPLAAVIACTGSAGCAKGLSDTKADAVRLAALRKGPGVSVHLTGCTRSCAAAHVAPATLLAVSAGHYDLYLRDAGLPGFGRLCARDLTLEAASALLESCSRSNV